MERVRTEAAALKWFGKAAEQGYARAQNELGLIYVKGEGVEMDGAEGQLIESLRRPILLNRNGISVGGLQPADALLRALG